MELQLIEVYIPNDKVDNFNDRLDSFDIVSEWASRATDQMHLYKLLIEKQHTEEILDFLETEANYDDKMQAILYDISTYLPREKIEEKEEEAKLTEEEKKAEVTRASRQELYHVVDSASHFTTNFRWMLILSAIVATVGIVKDSAAVVIGAMVIAPLIGPFTSLAFSAVLGDRKVMLRSSATASVGILLPLSIAIVFGFLFDIPVDSDEFSARLNVEFMDIILALAAGAAGALSFVKRVSEALVGVMVSVALLPPTVVLGMMLGSFEWVEAVTPLLLLLVNVNSILLSAIVVFWVTGIKPINWREIQVANTSRMIALIFVSVVILVLSIFIYIIAS
ncbi:TIGR00341 family protein [Pelagirhabdus alkalitolerans]|uniref:TIGR00341 family protein n=1 Tax=Pelagirhabdus alkalitolerans TaxID=1612202 RepID=A0A1G6KZ94_9BACI|nr:TIGR00341 family protein [Pelagirhabdus alkalitolerans]SDC36141.1 TIGR00341 family protein [Pelagirhabdus alkalitolerans]